MTVLVVDTGAQVNIDSGKALLGFRSVLPISTITGDDEDPLFPFINAIDFRDNTKYSPLITSGTVVLEFIQASAQIIDYFAFAIHNSVTAGMTGTLEIDSGLGYEVVSGFSAVPNNKPFIISFTAKTTLRQRLTLNFTSKLFIGSINIGKALFFNKCPGIGFQPGKTASVDKVEQFKTDGNNFIIGRRLNRGFQEKGGFRFLSFKDEINDWYVEYMNHVLDSKTLYFQWNVNNNETIYGVQNPKTLTKPSYVSSFYSDFEFEINGYT